MSCAASLVSTLKKMNKYYYDLHIHSCLSPCGDDDMTPSNIAGMATIKGLQIIALTDHNTTANLPAFFKACKRHGLIPIPGMELTVAEDIHLLCLFRTLEAAMEFGRRVDEYKIPYDNRPEIFGRQQVVDEEGNSVWCFDGKNAIRALELLGKHKGMWTDKVEMSGELDIAAIIMEARNRADKLR